MADFKRPQLSRHNDKLRENLQSPEFDGFPVEDLSVSTPTPKQKVQREKITRRDDDTVGDFNIGLEDHDEAIQYYFDNVIKPTVEKNGQTINVPLIYGSPERWKSVQKDGFFRDKEGKIQSPLVMFKRDSVTPRRDLGKKLDANNPHLHYTFQKQYTRKNQYDSFSVLQGRKPTQERYAVVIPDYVTIKYSFIIWTDYVANMNKLVESINYASDAYWGDPEKFKFNALIDGFQNRIDMAQGDNRMIKTDFGLTLQGYIIPDTINVDLNTHPIKSFSKSTVKFDTSTIDTSVVLKDREETREL